MRQAFLRSIFETPDDDAPRLVFADWLDDHGDADRADFIRTQCRLAKQVVPDVEDRLRCEDLLDEHEHEWLDGFPVEPDLRVRSFERGFVSWADVDDPASFRRHAAALLRTTARKVRFTREDGDERLPDDWPEFAWRRGPAGLSFTFFRFGPDETYLLAAWPNADDLRHLTIAYSDFDSESMAVLAGSRRFTRLEHLELPNHLVSADGVRALARSAMRLSTLDLSHDDGEDPDVNRIDAEAVAALCQAENLGRLTTLRLCPHELTAEIAESLAGSPHLRELRSLSLACNYKRAPEIRPLLGSPLLAGLHRLELSESFLSAEDAAALADSPAPPGLRSLSLGVCRCGAAGAEALLASPWAAGLTHLKLEDGPGLRRSKGRPPASPLANAALTGLRELNLGSAHAGDAALTALARNPHLGGVISLRLGYSGSLTERGLRALAGSAELTALRRLHFRGSHFGGKAVEALLDSPLASRLTALNLRAQRLTPPDVRPFLDRGRWLRLVRLELAENPDLDEEIREGLKECWGPAVRLEDDYRQYDWYD
jgi:uncharacterized protein (TIGR02996 family)